MSFVGSERPLSTKQWRCTDIQIMLCEATQFPVPEHVRRKGQWMMLVLGSADCLGSCQFLVAGGVWDFVVGCARGNTDFWLWETRVPQRNSRRPVLVLRWCCYACVTKNKTWGICWRSYPQFTRSFFTTLHGMKFAFPGSKKLQVVVWPHDRNLSLYLFEANKERKLYLFLYERKSGHKIWWTFFFLSRILFRKT